jgi:hypothetical protein
MNKILIDNNRTYGNPMSTNGAKISGYPGPHHRLKFGAGGE